MVFRTHDILGEFMSGHRKFSFDLLLIITFTVLVNTLILIPSFSTTFIQTFLCLSLIFFLPGYALTAVLFPAKSDLEGIGRTALSLGLSLALMPLISLGLNYTPLETRFLPILTIPAFTIIICRLAYLKLENTSLPLPEKIENM